VFPRDLEQRYLAALQEEIRAFSFPWTPETLYLGGGTPSLIENMRGLLELIPGGPWIEATMEAAPGTITREKARTWRTAGITRVSLGVQSFLRPEIARTGRKHTAQSVAEEVVLLRECGIADINIDLIAGLPGQTEASWRESLDWIERLRPEHVSVYMLEVDEDSRLGKEILLGGRRYGAPDTPSDELTAQLYETAVERLAAMGLPRYEISNFGKPSRHNLKYWKLEPYAGFGADAHSFDGKVRRANPESVTDYLAKRGACSIEANALEERFFVGLRLSEGIRPRPEEWRHFREPIARFVDAGLLERDGQMLRLTSRGVLLSNEVFQEFLT
jgi:oxygen-independent coproporphyrinogen-3 oxidase